ncbi:sensor histidine kinase [Caulobacter segnis]|uniref:Integral membrane sensor signal transduction histidine kinase n=2 Tax=Caulobacter segnis TaxID=88688 RepID=D5VL27_CAUST|nr:sensor histidine kinase [Caulobacter segnis]ADG11200.1 integral membrane sensor signal transduction histidine kinase [Caulobacter segnis ATCC 21756]AVQ02881.1 sensor histidine kinase [Caulobacter segnis]
MGSRARDTDRMNKDPSTSPEGASERHAGALTSPGRAFQARWHLIWLIYVPFYFISWLYRKPGPVELVASLAGAAFFLLLFWTIWRQRGRPMLWQVIVIFCLGLALSPFNVGWSVYTIYAMSFAARMTPRRMAIRTMIVLEVALLALGPLLQAHGMSAWVSGLLFGAVVGFAGLMQSDMERKNQELAIAHEEVRALATTAERERISRDLHDLLGHTLTLVAVKAELAARLVSRDAEAAEREMQAVAAAAREALGEVRTAVVGMRGASLAFELDKARQALAAANVQAEISALTTDGHPAQEAVLAMALREAVTNVIRHAGARRCEIRLEPTASSLVLTVADDGVGGKIAEGSGLKGMRARLAAIGGGLKIQSDKHGARLVATAPLKAAP